MQKILRQNLGNDVELAKKIVKYTWEKDEIAYFFCQNYRAVFKVKFTGKKWFLLDKWKEYSEKIYQFQYLESSKKKHKVETFGSDSNGIVHRNEEIFYSTKEEALSVAIKYVEKIAMDAIRIYEKDMLSLNEYNLKPQETII